MERKGRWEDMISREDYTVYFVADSMPGTHLGALYQLKIQQGSGEVGGLVFVCALVEKTGEAPRHSMLECARLHSKLYMLLGTGKMGIFRSGTPTEIPPTYYGYVLDTKSSAKPSYAPFNQPKASKPGGIVMSAYNKIYFLAHPGCYARMPNPSFERYDPTTNEWEPLSSYQYYHRNWFGLMFWGYAVCYGCILVCTCGRKGDYKVFHLSSGKWYAVEDAPRYGFKGRAVVVGDTIYAMALLGSGVLTFSLRRCSNAAGDIFYSLGATSFLDGLKIAPIPNDTYGHQSSNMVHLGNLVFCHLDTAFNSLPDPHQYLRVTTFQIEGTTIRTLDSAIRPVAHKFVVNFCFTLDCEDFEPEEAETTVTTNTLEPPEQDYSLTCDSNAVEDTTLEKHLTMEMAPMTAVN